MVMSGNSITITLGTVSNAGAVTPAPAGGTTQWTLPSPLPSDRAGNTVTGTPPSLIAKAF
jgi:hypothetical protein